jgi:hypothetical protein
MVDFQTSEGEPNLAPVNGGIIVFWQIFKDEKLLMNAFFVNNQR